MVDGASTTAPDGERAVRVPLHMAALRLFAQTVVANLETEIINVSWRVHTL